VIEVSKPPAAVFDLDGTLRDVAAIRFLINGSAKPKQFDEFYRRCRFAPCHRWVVEAAANQWRHGRVVVISTAQPERTTADNTYWLERFAVPWTALHTRPNGDHRSAAVIKQENLLAIQQRYDVAVAWDDDPAVLKMYQELGVQVVECPGWEAR
jgi:FMN phosphatase YigB (HAD superfamily)